MGHLLRERDQQQDGDGEMELGVREMHPMRSSLWYQCKEGPQDWEQQTRGMQFFLKVCLLTLSLHSSRTRLWESHSVNTPDYFCSYFLMVSPLIQANFFSFQIVWVLWILWQFYIWLMFCWPSSPPSLIPSHFLSRVPAVPSHILCHFLLWFTDFIRMICVVTGLELLILEPGDLTVGCTTADCASPRTHQ